ncbi:ferritin-like domain-containing protein [Phenylobacterium immobile]|uniref:ferritin-like domain-containing protein n=1 Tax=Phenylobacterium immobile TaxID=21 RepID=UPI00159EBA34|nr:ferritin-like domain-containing protein [Phenylobacterium immobile]
MTRVASLAEALAVITLIKEQGEGASGDIEDSHFQRFLAIQEEWAALSAAAPDFQPAWPAAHDPVMRRPLDMAERVWVTEPEAADLLDLGNAAYGGMLNLLSQAFGAGSAADQAHLMRAGVELMELSAAMGVALARRAATAERSGVNAGLTFTVPRNLGRRPRETKRHLLERVDVMQRRAEAILGGALLAKALRRCGACAEALGKLAG